MIPSKAIKVIEHFIANKFPILLTGAPGVGKTDLFKQACKNTKTELIVSHPVVSDPTDYKGLPFMNDEGEAHFMPFGELTSLIKAKKPTLFLLDDLGQAPSSVQASAMQLILSRRINGFKVSPHVIFAAATNRKEDMAGVSGILEPVKSRKKSIIQLDVSVDDWVDWAIKNNMPEELTSFIRFAPKMLHDFKPTRDMTNSPCPRTVANVGDLLISQIPDDLRYEVVQGAVGKSFAVEFEAFIKLRRNLPKLEDIVNDPLNTAVPNDPGIKYAVSGMLSRQLKADNINQIRTYMNRFPTELEVVLLRDALSANKELIKSKDLQTWVRSHKDLIWN